MMSSMGGGKMHFRFSFFAAAAVAVIVAGAAHGEVLVCKMTSYKGDGRRSIAEAVVPPRSTLVLSGNSARLKETGATGELTRLSKSFRIEFEDRMPDPVSGDAVIEWEIQKGGAVRVKTRAVRESPWDDFPERNGIFTITGTCRRR